MDIIKFYKYIAKLKQVKREGWVRKKIKNSESVAEHSFSTAVLAMVLAPRLKVNREKLIKMALIHDIGESVIGDVLWYTKEKGVDKKRLAKKQKDEDQAMKRILMMLADKKEYLSLWKEMVDIKTREARLLKEIDRLDLGIQAFFYEKTNRKNLEDFFDFVDLYIKHPTIKKIIKQVRMLRGSNS